MTLPHVGLGGGPVYGAMPHRCLEGREHGHVPPEIQPVARRQGSRVSACKLKHPTGALVVRTAHALESMTGIRVAFVPSFRTVKRSHRSTTITHYTVTSTDYVVIAFDR
jgi:hypothetical protein